MKNKSEKEMVGTKENMLALDAKKTKSQQKHSCPY